MCVCVCVFFYVEVQIDLIRVSVVGIVSGPWNKRLRNRGWAQEPYQFSQASRRRLGSTQPSIQWMPAAFPPGVKWLGLEADNSPLYNAEVENAWNCTSTPP